MLRKTAELPPYPCHEYSKDSKEASGVLEVAEEEVGGWKNEEDTQGWMGRNYERGLRGKEDMGEGLVERDDMED